MDILGHKSWPVEWAYVALEHSMEETIRTAERVGVSDLLQDRLFSTIDNRVADDFSAVLRHVQIRIPEVRFLVLDGVVALIKDGLISDYGAVKTFVRGIREKCVSAQLTVLGVGLDSKPSGSTFIPYRQRPAGSHAWGQFCSTIFVMERMNPRQVADPERRLVIEPRNAVGEEHRYTLDSMGKLQHTEEQMCEFFLDHELQSCPAETLIFSRDVRRWAEKHNISRSETYRWIDKCIQEKKLERVRQGEYLAKHPPASL